ncbi:MAG: hypothetical protein KC621_15625 [Myxococcales bacterium]|nr:hypothetical protein [Myxococcales bacterium]
MGGDDDQPEQPRASFRIATPPNPVRRDAPTGTYVPFSETDTSDELPDAVLKELTDELVDGFLQNLATGHGPEPMDADPTPPTTLARTQRAPDESPPTPPTPQLRSIAPPMVTEPEQGPVPVAERVPDLLDLFATPVHPTPEREFPRVAALSTERPPSPPSPAPARPAPPPAEHEPELPAPASAGLFARFLAMIRGLFA